MKLYSALVVGLVAALLGAACASPPNAAGPQQADAGDTVSVPPRESAEAENPAKLDPEEGRPAEAASETAEEVWPTPHERYRAPAWDRVPALWSFIDDDFPNSGPSVWEKLWDGRLIGPEKYVQMRAMGVPSNQAQADEIMKLAPAIRRMRIWESVSRHASKQEVNAVAISSLVLPNLEFIQFNNVLAVGEDMSWLPLIAPRLRRLVIEDCNTLTDSLFQTLKQCTELRYLEIRDMNGITGVGLSALKELSIEHLVLGLNGLNPAALGELPSLSAVSTFELSAGNLVTEDFRNIASMPSLRSLKISTTESSYERMGPLASSSTLREITGAGRWLNDVGASHIAKIPGLETFSWGHYKVDCMLTDASLKAFAAAPNLKKLVFYRSGFTDVGVKALREHPTLEFVAFHENGRGSEAGPQEFTEAVFSHLATLPNLRVLHLRNCGLIDGRGVLELASAEKLEELRLNLYVDPEKVDKSPPGLAELKELRPELFPEANSED